MRLGQSFTRSSVAKTRRPQETAELCAAGVLGATGRRSKVLHKSFVGPLLAGIRPW